jgi:hypothetical protein
VNPNLVWRDNKVKKQAGDAGSVKSDPDDGGPEVLVISFSDMKRDSRVFRQINFLKDLYKVSTLGFGSSEIPGVEFFHIEEREKTTIRNMKRAICLKTHHYDRYYRETFDLQRITEHMSRKKISLIVANDNDSLPLAFDIQGKAKVLHDAHEYAPKQHEDSISWRFFMQPYRNWTCETYLRKCDSITTVSQGIADAYRRNFGVKVEVITNAPEYEVLEPSKVDGERIRLIHHGYANPGRRIETLIEMMDHLDRRFKLDLMLLPKDLHYFEKIKNMVGQRNNVEVINPVPMRDIVRTINSYDIGVFIAEPVTFNLQNVLPNKFFEFIQARLAVAIGPSPEMARYVLKYDCGVVSKDFTANSMADELNRLTKERIEHYKRQSHLAARELSAEMNMSVLGEMVDRLLTGTCR